MAALLFIASLFFAAVVHNEVVSADASFDQKYLTLEKVIAVNRHGHRAPNAPYWQMCPNDIANKNGFGVNPEDLTSRGFDEEIAFGRFLRAQYNGFIAPKFNNKKDWFSAVGEPRTLQSADGIAFGLYGGWGEKRHIPAQPQLIPIFADRQFDEYLLNDAPCWPQSARDVSAWLRDVGNPLAETPSVAPIVNKLLNLCGTPPQVRNKKGIDFIIKVLVDGIVFSHDYGLTPLKGKIDPKYFFELRNLSNTYLMGKLYATDAQKTYMASDLPEFLVESVKYVASNHSHKFPATFSADYEIPAIQAPTLNVFCVHREMMYGLAFFFGWEYAVDKMGPGELPAGSSVVLELHRNRVDGSLWVKTYLWTPYTPTYELKIPECANAPYCSVEEFAAVYDTRVRRTGTWKDICRA